MNAYDLRRKAILEAEGPYQPSTLHGLIDRVAARYPERAFVIADRNFTYREMQEWSAELAEGLRVRGVQAGDRVAMLIANYAEFVPVKLAISRLGAVAVPLNYLYRRVELEYALRQSRSNFLITMTEFADLGYLEMLDEIAPGWEDGSQSSLPELRGVVVFENQGARRSGVDTLESMRSPVDTEANPFEPVQPDAVSDIMYTSGSTGAPKGVVMQHDRVLRSAFGAALTRAHCDGRRLLFSLPLYHAFGYIEGLLSVPWVGGSVVLQRKFSPEDYFSGIQEHHVDEILTVPTMTVALLESHARPSYDLSSLSAIFSAAAPTPRWVWDRVRDELGITDIVTGYGLTESGAGVTITRPEQSLDAHVSTVGLIKMIGDAGLDSDPLTFASIRTADPISGDLLPDGAEGELVIRAASNMVGYWEKPDETAAALRDGWLYSGDLGIISPGGELRLTGRAKELYKSGGELVMPKEIEEILTVYPGVSQAFAIGVPDERWGEAGCAVIVRDAGAEVTEAELIAHLRHRLARFKIPKRVVFPDAADLPSTPTGKIQKFALIKQVQQILAAEHTPAVTGR